MTDYDRTLSDSPERLDYSLRGRQNRALMLANYRLWEAFW